MVRTVGDYIATHGVNLLWRFILCTLFFVVWWRDPSWVPGLVGVIAPGLAELFKLNLVTAAIYGYCSDSVIDYLLWFVRSRVPAPTN
jgi:hypothetical protein